MAGEEKKLYGFFSGEMCVFLKNEDPMPFEQKAGVFEASSASRLRVDSAVVYSTPSGGEMVVTCVGREPGKATEWPDEKPMGEVSRYLRGTTEAEIVDAYPFMAKAFAANASSGNEWGDVLWALAQKSAPGMRCQRTG
jgi:hypothetical protein